MTESLIHDVCWAQAHALMDLVGHLLRDEEQRELFAQFYNTSRASLEAFCIQEDRMRRRICPSKN